MKKNILIIIVIISSLMVSISIYYISKSLLDTKNTKEVIQSLKRVPKQEINNNNYPAFLVNPPDNKSDPYWYFVKEPFLNIDFTNLLKENSDTIGWINIPSTSIDYPILQTKDNKYYLTHSFNKKTSAAGWVFADYRNNFNNCSKNTIIYAHRRLDNTMFGPLINYLNLDYLKEYSNQIIKLSTLKENLIYEIVSVYTINEENYYLKINFNNNSYEEFLNTIKNRSIYNFNTSLNTSDTILTLSTCYNNSGKRIVIHSKLIKKETR